MEYLDLALRCLHVIAAITLIGGTIFMRVAVLPACRQLDTARQASVEENVRRGWSRLLMPSILFLILSGIINTAKISTAYRFPGNYYTPLLTIKLFLAIAIFYIAVLLAGRGEEARHFRKRQAFWLNINILLAVLLVCVAGAMRLADREPKTPRTPAPAAKEVRATSSSGDSPIRGNR